MGKRKPTQINAGTGVKMEQALAEFLQDRRASSCRDVTLDSYRISATAFIHSLPEGITTDQITKQNYDDFIISLKNDTAKNEVSVQSYARKARTFLYYMMDEGLTEPFKCKLPKAQQQFKDLYTDDEIARLLKKPEAGCYQTEYMIWAFEHLIFATGIRLDSARHLKVSDLNKNILTVNTTKSNKALQLAINDDCMKVLRQYIRAFDLQPDDFLFVSATGEMYRADTLKKYVSRYNRARQVEKTSTHLIRHSFASRYYLQTGDIFALSRILGHSEISTTQKYLRSLGSFDIGQKMASFSIASDVAGHTKQKRRGRMNNRRTA